MNHKTFSSTRRQASAATLAVTLTLATLFGLQLLATTTAADLTLAANPPAKATANANMASQAARTPRV